MENQCFLELLQMAAGTRDTMTCVPDSEDEWIRLFHLFDGQALLGVSFPAVEKLSQETEIPLVVLLSWENAARSIQRRNLEHRDAVKSLYRAFIDEGFRCCILKGQVSAALYPRPELRQAGDIDIWVDGTREKVVEYLRDHFKLHKIRYIHADVKVFENIRVEVHFTPSWMFSPLSNRRLQRWFTSCAPQQFDNYDDALETCIPTLSFNGVYMMLHIYRHLLEEGVGLRQFMDYYFLLRHLDDNERNNVVTDLRRLGMLRFAGAVMYVLKEVFQMESEYLLCQPSPCMGRFLLEEIMISGNFGQTDPVFSDEKSRKEGIVAHGWRKIKRNLRFFQFCPSEVFWMPLFNTWQYFWRKKNGYLYKGR